MTTQGLIPPVPKAMRVIPIKETGLETILLVVSKYCNITFLLHVWKIWYALLPTPHGSNSQDRLSDGVQHPDVEDCPVFPEPGVRQRRAKQPGGVAHELESVEYNCACTFCLLEETLVNSVSILKVYT